MTQKRETVRNPHSLSSDGRAVRIAFSAKKGGSGKTMLTANMAAMFANEGYRVLIIGQDSQEDLAEAYLSGTSGYDIDNHSTLCDVLTGETGICDAAYTTREYRKYRFNPQAIMPKHFRTPEEGETYTIDIVPAGRSVSALESMDIRVLDGCLEEADEAYDIILFDTPPSENNGVMQVLMVCDYIFIPVDDIAGFRSVQTLMDDIELANENGSSARCLGVIVNKFQKNWAVDKQISELFYNSLGDMLIKDPIPLHATIKSAFSTGTPVVSFDQTRDAHKTIYRVYEEVKDRILKAEGRA